MIPEAESLKRILKAIGPIEWQDGKTRKRLIWQPYGFIIECQYSDGLEDAEWYHYRTCEYPIARALILEAAMRKLKIMPGVRLIEAWIENDASVLVMETPEED